MLRAEDVVFYVKDLVLDVDDLVLEDEIEDEDLDIKDDVFDIEDLEDEVKPRPQCRVPRTRSRHRGRRCRPPTSRTTYSTRIRRYKYLALRIT